MALIALAKVLNDGRVDLITLHHSWIIALPRGYARKLMVAWRKEAVKGESANNRKHLGNDWERVAYRHEKDSATPEMLLSDVAEPVV